MPACPSAPCFSPKATGSVPLLRDLLSDADVTRLHTLRPAPAVPIHLRPQGGNRGALSALSGKWSYP